MADGSGTPGGVGPWVDTSDLHPLIEGQEPPYDEPTPDDTPPPDQFGVTSPPPPSPPSYAGQVLMALGLVCLVSGGLLIVAGDFVSHSVQSFDQQCSQVPGCHPEANPSAGLYGGGIGLVALGVFLFVIGYRRSASLKAWEASTE